MQSWEGPVLTPDGHVSTNPANRLQVLRVNLQKVLLKVQTKLLQVWPNFIKQVFILHALTKGKELQLKIQI